MSPTRSKCDPHEYAGWLDQLRRLMAKKDKNQEDWTTIRDLSDYVVENSTPKNPLDREIAEVIIEQRQEVDLDSYGGYPARFEKTFEADGRRYSAIAFGCSEANEGKDAIDGIVFVWEEAPPS